MLQRIEFKSTDFFCVHWFSELSPLDRVGTVPYTSIAGRVIKNDTIIVVTFGFTKRIQKGVLIASLNVLSYITSLLKHNNMVTFYDGVL